LLCAIEALKACRQVYFVRIAGAAAHIGSATASDNGSNPTAPSFAVTSTGPYNLENGFTFSTSVSTDSGSSYTAYVATVAAVAATVVSAADTVPYSLGGMDCTITVTVDRETTPQVVHFTGSETTAEEIVLAINSSLRNCHAILTDTDTTVTLRSDRRGTGSYIDIAAGAVCTALGFASGETATTAGNVSNADAVTGTEVKTMIELVSTGLVLVGTDITGTSVTSIYSSLTSTTTYLRIDTSTGFGSSPLVNATPLGSGRPGTNGSAPSSTVRFDSKTVGTHADDITVTITTNAAPLAGTVKAVVKYRGSVVETYDKLWKGPVGVAPPSIYLDLFTTINSGSTDGTYPASNYINATEAGVTAFIPAAGIYTLSTGSDDGDNWGTANVIGTITGSTKTGMQCYSNPEEIFINVLSTPGMSQTAIITEGLSMAQQRADCIYIVDCPKGLSATEVVKWSNGDSSVTGVLDQNLTTGVNSTQFNSNFGALYYPYVRMYDKYSETNVWLPPSSVVLRTIAYTDEVADPWFAPAGPNRTQAINALQLEYSPTQGERDLMQMPGNNVNPLAVVYGQGILIMGQKTLQRTPSALDRVNVRRCMLAIEKVIATASVRLMFEPNDQTMWRRFINLVSPVLDDVKARRGLYDYRVVADSTTNTSLMIDQSTFVGKIFLKPTKAAEIIILDFCLVPSGASFQEYTQA
jgi:phage tail sheath protein FI